MQRYEVICTLDTSATGKFSSNFHRGEKMIGTLRAERDGMGIVVKRIGNIYGYDGGNYAGNVYDQSGISPSLLTTQGGNRQPMVIEKMEVRKLTEREYYRLMGFTDEDFEKAASVISKTQLYKTAGNSIVVQVLEAIFKQMLPEKGDQP